VLVKAADGGEHYRQAVAARADEIAEARAALDAKFRLNRDGIETGYRKRSFDSWEGYRADDRRLRKASRDRNAPLVRTSRRL
jgi:hypothetical protein